MAHTLKTLQVFALALVLAALPSLAHAAALQFSHAASSCTVGADCKVTVRVSSPDQAMNAASGVVSFPTDKLEVRSLSKSSSIFSLWAQEPAYSNQKGTVSFEGIVLNPGFTGNGTILTITFRPKVPGTVSLSFAEGQILANDGAATNILSTLGTTQLTVAGAPPVAEKPKAAAAAPARPATPEATTTLGIGLPDAPVVRVRAVIEPPIPVFAERTLMIAAIILLAVVVLLLLWVLWHVRRVHAHARGHLFRGAREADVVVHRAFDLLRQELSDSVHDLEKVRTRRELTHEEDKLLKQFKRSLDETEATVHDEIKSVVR